LKERGDDKLQEALIGKILLTTLLLRSSVVMAVAKTLTSGHEHKHLSNYACYGLPKLRQELVQATINYLCGKKPGAGKHKVAWAPDTGKGLLFFSKKGVGAETFGLEGGFCCLDGLLPAVKTAEERG
jgi:hypothetical protein